MILVAKRKPSVVDICFGTLRKSVNLSSAEPRAWPLRENYIYAKWGGSSGCWLSGTTAKNFVALFYYLFLGVTRRAR